MNIDNIFHKVIEYGKLLNKSNVVVKFTGYTDDELVSLYSQLDKFPGWRSYHLHDDNYHNRSISYYIKEYGGFNFKIREQYVVFRRCDADLLLEKSNAVDLSVIYSL